MKNNHAIAEKLLGVSYDAMDERTRKVIHHIVERKHISKNPSKEYEDKSTRGQRAADAVASFGGSWIFIAIFALVMLSWIILNTIVLTRLDETFDPYPYILLNLVLSMLAAIQAPIILMSQNRQGEKDRRSAEHDYEVNLKAELEIMLLHEKIDALKEKQWAELIAIQQKQIDLLENLVGKVGAETTQQVTNASGQSSKND